MGSWYTIGLFAGLGVAVGVLVAGWLAATRAGLVAALVLAAAAGVGIALVLSGELEAVAAGAGGLLGAGGAAQLVRGTLRRGGTRGGTAILLGAGALALAALAFVPVVGYLEAVAVPFIAARLRRHAGETYAGLRILARD